MRRTLALLVSLSLLGVSLAGCKPTASPPAPAAPAPVAPAPAPSTPAPLPTGNCTPGATAMDLPSSPYGGGIAVKPPQPGGTAEHPWVGYLSADQMEQRTDGGGGILGMVYMPRGGTATVDVGPFWLRGFIMPAPSEAWVAQHLKLEGIKPESQSFNAMGDSGTFDMQIPAGRPGDAFRLTFTDTLQGDVTFTFCRQAPPRAAMERRSGQPLVLKLTFTSDMIPESVEQSLTGPHDKEGRSQGDWITAVKWLDARTVELTADKPAPVMRMNLRSAQDRNGLFVSGGVPNVYAGGPPRVIAIAPTGGEETTLAEVPPEPQGWGISTDGKLLRVAVQQMLGGYDVPEWQHLLVDLTTGKSTPLKPEDPWGQWLPSGDVVSVRPNGNTGLLMTHWGKIGLDETRLDDLPPFDSFYLSPDGKSIALAVRTDSPTPYPWVPVRFLIMSVEGKNRKELTGDAQMFRPGKDGLRLYGPAWSPDGTRIAMTQPDGKGGTALVVADVAAGALRTLTPKLEGSQGSGDAVTWSPDGSKLLVGPLLLNATTGERIRRIEGMAGLPRWSPDGTWVLFQQDDWQPITAYNITTGRSQALGEGLALGWRPDGKALIMRWPDAAHRTMWGY